MKGKFITPAAERFESIRTFLGMLQKDMALRLEVSRRSYTQYAVGELLPPTPALLKLAKEGFDVTWLLTGETPRYSGAPDGKWMPSFLIPGQEAWLLDEKFMAELLEGIANCYASAGKIPSYAELASSIARIVGDIAAVSKSAEQRDAALKLSLIQLRRQISE